MGTPKALKILEFQGMNVHWHIHRVTPKALKVLKFMGRGIHRNIHFNAPMDTPTPKLEDFECFGGDEMDVPIYNHTTTLADFSDLTA